MVQNLAKKPRKVLFMAGPSQDKSDRFFGWPTPLLYAISPTINSIKEGRLELEYVPKLFEPIWYVEGLNSDKIKEEFMKQTQNVDIICTSVLYDSLYPTLQLLAEIKKQNPTIVAIAGGPHFDGLGNSELINPSHWEIIDFIVAGDGEYALEALLQALSRNSFADFHPEEISGKARIYSKGGDACRTSGEPIPLEHLPFIPIEMADVSRHKNDFDIFSDSSGILPTIQMIAQRGCPYHCTFCSERKGLTYPNARSVDNILQEVELRKKQGFKAIFFDDSIFSTYPNLNQLLPELGKTGMMFGSLNRFDMLGNKHILDLYWEAGFRYFYCSIEQFDDATLERMAKSQNVQQISESMHLISRRGFTLGVSLLYGFPWETENSINKTIDFTHEWITNGPINLVSESVLSYHPGTPLARNMNLDFNRTPPHQGFPFDRFEEGQWYHPQHVTADRLEKIYCLSFSKFREYLVRERHSWVERQGLLD